MTSWHKEYFSFKREVARALEKGEPIVALESTVITHGLPYPENGKLAQELEAVIREQGCIPATIAILEGSICVGLESRQIAKLAEAKEMLKISVRDIATAVVKQQSGGTTVAGTLAIAQQAGIKVFATGGIGGVHRNAPFDISADLGELARTQLVVVCAGAKAILDIPATIEVLETYGIPVIGYQADEFPAFYSTSSGMPVSARVETGKEAARLAKTHWELGRQSSVLVVVPPPADVALSDEVVEAAIQVALEDAQKNDIHGQAMTPFLLGRVSELTGGSSLRANLGLLRNNARVAAEIAKFIRPQAP